MSTDRIPGNPGSLPETPTSAVSDPTPKRVARLVREGRLLMVELEGRRFEVEDPTGVLREQQQQKTTVKSAEQPAPKRVPSVPLALLPALEAASRHRKELLAKGAASVRAGYLFKNGLIATEPAIVVAVLDVRRGAPLNKPAIREKLGIPEMLDGVAVDIEIVDPYQRIAMTTDTESFQLSHRPRLLIDEIQEDPAEEALEAVPVITYTAPLGGNLSPVTGAMTITCHVSPDAGWHILQPFLEATEHKLHLGMYDFTAPHIYRTARTLLKNSEIDWQQVLSPGEALPTEDDADSPKANDLTEASIVRGMRRVAGDRFSHAFAHIGAGRTFASAYHIKVAVRDDKAFWLSSGNWQSSNQPDIDFFDESTDRQLIQRYNREWHMLCENTTLAQRFQRFLDHDFETAFSAEEAAPVEAEAFLPDLLIPAQELLEEERAALGLQVFAPQKFVFTKQNPLTVQPILTPDNYLRVVLDFLRRKPSKRLYFQNQSLNPVQQPTPEFEEMMMLLVNYSNDKELDVRFIFRNIGPIRKKLESLQAAGFNMSRIRSQAGCHTKGIIVDSEWILLGSHNVTNQGVQANRDASLLIHDADIAQYYEKVFRHDWEKLARSVIREEAVPLPVGSREATLEETHADMIRVPFSYFDEE
jgi:hypothetical protein